MWNVQKPLVMLAIGFLFFNRQGRQVNKGKANNYYESTNETVSLIIQDIEYLD
jgi:hypothetical protein